MKKIEYIPKFTVSGKAMRLIMEIAAALERYKIVMEGPDGVRLRKLNHIRTIRGTTAIEGNTLTEDQITAVLAGKRVVATRRHRLRTLSGRISRSIMPRYERLKNTTWTSLHLSSSCLTRFFGR